MTSTGILPATIAQIPSSFPYTVSGYKVDNRVGCWGQAVVGLYVDGKLAVTARNDPRGGPAELDPRNPEERTRLAQVLAQFTAAGITPPNGREWDEESLADLCLIEGEAVKDLNRRQNVVFVKSPSDLEKNVLRLFSKSSHWTPERISQALAKFPGSLYWSKQSQAWVQANA